MFTRRLEMVCHTKRRASFRWITRWSKSTIFSAYNFNEIFWKLVASDDDDEDHYWGEINSEKAM